MINPLILLHHKNMLACYGAINMAGTIWNFPYTGTVQNITLGKGVYKLEVWGAQGGSYSSYYGGAGGYSYGTLTLTESTTLYIYAGGQPASSTTIGVVTGGFNGGGNGCCRYYSGTYTYGQGGGGGSDIRIGQDSLYARVIVAGGGGGSASVNALTTKYGGGTTGGSASGSYQGTQSSAGSGGSFGKGSSSGTGGTNYKYGAGGGGGGWYGGGATTSYSDSTSDYRNQNGGGSGFVWTGSNAPSGYLLTSKYYLSDAQTISGNLTITNPSGSNTTGNQGNGYCRITCIRGEGTGNIKPEFVDYIESNGTLYIDTGITPSDDLEVEISFKPTSTVAEGAIFGSDWSTTGYFLMYYNSKWRFHTRGYVFDSPSSINSSKFTTLKTSSSSIIIDETKSMWTKGSSTDASANILLFYANGSYTAKKYGLGQVAYMKMWKGGSLVRNYVPAIKDGVYGLWDKVEKKFYGSATDSLFSGPLPKGYTQIEYILTLGYSYINTNIIPNLDTLVIMDVYLNPTLADTPIFGARTSYNANAYSVWYNVSNFYSDYNTEYLFIPGTVSGRCLLNKNKNLANLNGLNFNFNYANFSAPNPMLIGTTYNAGNPYSPGMVGKIYYCKIYSNGILIRDYVPCKNSENIYGLYDKVGNLFYKSESSTQFTGG